jgi:hypothetical protein
MADWMATAVDYINHAAATEGTRIVVPNEARKAVVESAIARMYPDDNIPVVVDPRGAMRIEKVPVDKMV